MRGMNTSKKKGAPESLDLSRLQHKEMAATDKDASTEKDRVQKKAVTRKTGAAKDDKGVSRPTKEPSNTSLNEQGMLVGEKKMELYRNIEILVKICIEAAMETRRNKQKQIRMNVDFGKMKYHITEKRVELVHKETKHKLKYVLGSHEILLNDTKKLPDIKCRKFVVWVKKLIDDWAKAKADSVCTWVDG